MSPYSADDIAILTNQDLGRRGRSTLMILEHQIEIINGTPYEFDPEGFACIPCGWKVVTGDDWPTCARAMLEHIKTKVPVYRINHGIVYCNMCGFSSGNAGLDMSLQGVISDHLARTNHYPYTYGLQTEGIQPFEFGFPNEIDKY